MDLETLSARAEITDVLYRYARAVDRRDWDLLRSCYHDDGYDDHGTLKGYIDDFIAASKPFTDRVAATTHFIGNVLIEIDGDVARVESYVMANHRIEDATGAGKDDTWGIRYVDRFERRRQEWRIAYRVVAHEWRLVADVPAGRGRDSYPRFVGSHDGSDPLRWILDVKPPPRE
jgi:ketosteroid isomerase-like protein